MADIFISYSQEDRAWVNRLVDALTAEGYDVWWDLRICAGESFDELIESTLEQASCAIGVWSKNSVKSKWVRAESAWAMDQNIFVSIKIENDLKIPLKFYHVHTASMADWNGSRDHAEFQWLLQDIGKIGGPPPSAAAVPASTSQVPAPTPPEPERTPEVHPKQEPTPGPASKPMSGTQAPTPPQAEPESSLVVKPTQEPTPASRTATASRSETGTSAEPRPPSARPIAPSTSRPPGFAIGMIALAAAALVGLLFLLNTRDESEFGGEPEEPAVVQDVSESAPSSILADTSQEPDLGSEPQGPDAGQDLSTLAPSPVPPDIQTQGTLEPEMVVIPAGEFQMGCVSGKGCDDDELPVRTVTFGKPFAMGKYEVTFAEYDRFAEATGREKPNDAGWGRGKRPVIWVSWDDAQAYV